ncbi:MAG: bifunctional folylpolyglutamate synthase/dihydrofolate synthase [Clostridia bacterium]|nr:bifunctional folylpolyglutamate synthase/dihydrofolate synthase [Clostridia bacterium]
MTDVMDLKSAEIRLEGYGRFSAVCGLDGIAALLEGLGNPHRELKYVHVAGTNGKGSTTAMIATALTSAGYKTGMYTSPSVEKLTERVCLNMEQVDDGVFARALNRTMDVACGLGISPARFDILTAAAFSVFAEAGCQIVCTEVGLGGRFDATNIIPPPEVAVITSISLDHTAQLGTDIAAIASEKCGILKGGCPLVCSAGQAPEAAREIEKAARNGGYRLTVPNMALAHIESMGPWGSCFSYRGRRYNTTMPGRHFVSNAVTAVEALEVLREKGYSLEEKDIASGIAAKALTGRLQTVCVEPTVMVDGAHNPDGAEKLCSAMNEMFGKKRIITLMGMYSDKDYVSCVSKVAKISDVFFAVEPAGSRALPAEKIARAAKAETEEVILCSDVYSALRKARELWQEGDIILCCGSFGLAAEIKGALEKI